MKHVQHRAKHGSGVKNTVIAIMLVVFLAGLCYALYPVMTGAALMYESRRVTDTFLQSITENTPAEAEETDSLMESEEEQTMIPYPELLAAMQAYNEQIYMEGQSGLCDPWAYTAPSFDLAEYGIEDGVIGVLSIPKIGLKMPIYLGATYDHMAAGAAHLSQTSLPIGGINTNAVIAGHRGWRGAPYFLNLDKLEIGDEITVTNLWDTLTYRVCEIRVIEPNDIEEVLIQPGRDMLTLLTCHPYASGGRYRLVVYCERDQATAATEIAPS